MLVPPHFSFATTWNHLEPQAQLRWVAQGTSVCVHSSSGFLDPQMQSGCYFQFSNFSLYSPSPTQHYH